MHAYEHVKCFEKRMVQCVVQSVRRQPRSRSCGVRLDRRTWLVPGVAAPSNLDIAQPVFVLAVCQLAGCHLLSVATTSIDLGQIQQKTERRDSADHIRAHAKATATESEENEEETKGNNERRETSTELHDELLAEAINVSIMDKNVSALRPLAVGPLPPPSLDKAKCQENLCKCKKEETKETPKPTPAQVLWSDDCWIDANYNVQFSQIVVLLFCIWEFTLIQSVFAAVVFTNYAWVSIAFASLTALLGLSYLFKLGTIVCLFIIAILAFCVMVVMNSSSFIWALVVAVIAVSVGILLYLTWNVIKLDVGVWAASFICSAVLVYCVRFVAQTCDVMNSTFSECSGSKDGFRGMPELNNDLLENFPKLCEGIEPCQERVMFIFALVILRVSLVRMFDPFLKEHLCFGYTDSERRTRNTSTTLS